MEDLAGHGRLGIPGGVSLGVLGKEQLARHRHADLGTPFDLDLLALGALAEVVLAWNQGVSGRGKGLTLHGLEESQHGFRLGELRKGGRALNMDKTESAVHEVEFSPRPPGNPAFDR